jgi:hypothetical protein
MRTFGVTLSLALIVLLLVAPGLFEARGVLARSGGASTPLGTGYDLSWWTVDGGGATFSGDGGYALGGTIGQPDAAVWGGNGTALAGGFWGGMLVEVRVYLPLVVRDS